MPVPTWSLLHPLLEEQYRENTNNWTHRTGTGTGVPSTAFPTTQPLSHPTAWGQSLTPSHLAPSHLTQQSSQFSFSLLAFQLFLPGIFSCVRSSGLDPCPPHSPGCHPKGIMGTKRVMTQCFTPKPFVKSSQSPKRDTRCHCDTGASPRLEKDI